MIDIEPKPQDQSPQLLRTLGPVVALSVVVGNVIGSGIFLKPGTIAADGGNFWLIISVWILGGLLCICGALCLAELAAMIPRAGGLYVYLREAYGRVVAFLFGWNDLMFARPASIAALAMACSGTLNASIGRQFHSHDSGSSAPNEFAIVLVAVALIAAMTWINVVGVAWGGRVQLVTTVAKFAGLVLVAAAPFALTPFTDQGVQLANFSTTVPVEGNLSTRIGLVLLSVMWAYNGWDVVTPLAEELRDPQRNIPISLLGGVGILIFIYLAANFAYHGAMTMTEMSQQGEHASEFMLKKLAGPTGLMIMSSIVACSTLGAINTNLLHAPRITFAMGRDGVFFRGFGHVHARFRTPVVAILVTSVMSILLLCGVALFRQMLGAPQFGNEQPPATTLGRIIVGVRDGSIFDLLTNFAIFGMSIFYLLAVLAVVVLRFRLPTAERPFRTWGYPVTPLLYVAIYVWFLTQIYMSKPLESRSGLVLIGLGLPAYFAYQAISRASSHKTR